MVIRIDHKILKDSTLHCNAIKSDCNDMILCSVTCLLPLTQPLNLASLHNTMKHCHKNIEQDEKVPKAPPCGLP